MNKEILCKCLLECKDKILVFTNFTSLVLISTMIALLVILFIIKIFPSFTMSLKCKKAISFAVKKFQICPSFTLRPQNSLKPPKMLNILEFIIIKCL